MTWSDRDCWRDSGGFQQVWPATEYEAQKATEEDAAAQYKEPGSLPSDSATPVVVEKDTIFEKKLHYPIHSLHWFSQHSGARQWLLWEQQKTFTPPESGHTLDFYAFDGTLVGESDVPDYPGGSTPTGVMPWRKLKKWAQEKNSSTPPYPQTLDVDDRVAIGIGVKTQSET